MADPGRDYYALLGVRPDADGAALRLAWRRLALRWHPDRAGAGATELFQELSAAYEVLSDPLARVAYDRARRNAGTPTPAAAPRAAPPEVPLRAAPAVSLQRVCGALGTLIALGAARRGDDGVIELLLRPDEAAQGGMVTVSMRVAVRCGDCASAPVESGCERCGGARVVEELFSAWLAVPPGVPDGATLAPPVPLRGMLHPVSFRIRVPSR